MNSENMTTRDYMNNKVSTTTDDNTHASHSSVPSVPSNAHTAHVTINSLREPAYANIGKHPLSDETNDAYSTNSNGDSRRSISADGSMSDTIIQNLRDLNVDPLHVPIVGYEVMEERARFTIYKLKVQDAKSKQSWLVFRRYTDFVRLYSRVKTERPNVNLPLPGKRWFRDNFEPLFLEERVRGLQVFVNSIIKRLPTHPRVREFFCLDEPPQSSSYQPEVQAVYGAMEDNISALRVQLRQRDATISLLQQRLRDAEEKAARCSSCSNMHQQL